MFWLIWQMGVLLVIFSGLGLLVGYLVWSGDARSIDADKAQADNARLRQENENLARRLGEASARGAPSAEAAPQVAPALLTRISSCDSRAPNSSTTRSISLIFDRSAGSETQCPSVESSAAVASQTSALRDVMYTRAPCST